MTALPDSIVPAPSTPPIYIHVPEGMHAIVSIEFQGFLIKTATIIRLPSTGDEDESTILHLRNCNTNVCNAAILRGFNFPVTYELNLACYDIPCSAGPATTTLDLERYNEGGDSVDNVSAYTMAYHLKDKERELGADYFVITIVCQLTKCEIGSSPKTMTAAPHPRHSIMESGDDHDAVRNGRRSTAGKTPRT
ncbi:MAG: hypothetical protein JWQ98_1652 [Chlorobi bacterium]|nr:hypothetical protein [Chlorobiota bacterium]